MNAGVKALDRLHSVRAWNSSCRSKEYKYATFRDRPWLLYDLEEDPYEMDNPADDARHSNLIRMLYGTIKQRMQRTGDKWDEQYDVKVG